MSRHRPPNFNLRTAIASISFTPGERDFASLLLLFSEDDEKLHLMVERALLRAGKAARAYLEAHFSETLPPVRGRVCRMLGRFYSEMAAETSDEALKTFLMARLGDEDVRTRRYAAGALGKREDAGIEDGLLLAWEGEADLSVRRVLAGALGKIGGERAAEALSEAETKTQDSELARILSEARLRLSQRGGRVLAGSIAAERVVLAEVPFFLLLRCRRGVERILKEEADEKEAKGALSWQARVELAGQAGEVRGRFAGGSLSQLFGLRTALSFGFVLPIAKSRTTETPEKTDKAERIARALVSEEARRIFAAFSEGGVSYRLSWAEGGKKRAAVLAVAEAASRLWPALRNDPVARNWEVLVCEPSDGNLELELRPRLPDPRFAGYREFDVPAASHPTLAAALVRLSGVRADDVVWDPFVGSGTELVERALAGPYRAMWGNDIDAAALTGARSNLTHANVLGVELRQADALAFTPGSPPSLVLTNPPMGRRVNRHEDLGPMFDRFIAHVARQLAPKGRLVWISPVGARSAARAQAAGLRVSLRQTVDMGGFDAEFQIIEKV